VARGHRAARGGAPDAAEQEWRDRMEALGEGEDGSATRRGGSARRRGERRRTSAQRRRRAAFMATLLAELGPSNSAQHQGYWTLLYAVVPGGWSSTYDSRTAQFTLRPVGSTVLPYDTIYHVFLTAVSSKPAYEVLKLLHSDLCTVLYIALFKGSPSPLGATLQYIVHTMQNCTLETGSQKAFSSIYSGVNVNVTQEKYTVRYSKTVRRWRTSTTPLSSSLSDG